MQLHRAAHRNCSLVIVHLLRQLLKPLRHGRRQRGFSILFLLLRSQRLQQPRPRLQQCAQQARGQPLKVVLANHHTDQSLGRGKLRKLGSIKWHRKCQNKGCRVQKQVHLARRCLFCKTGQVRYTSNATKEVISQRFQFREFEPGQSEGAVRGAALIEFAAASSPQRLW